jgi:hypothetical protein
MQNAFIRNRAEEFDHDVWSRYVLPLYYPELGLNEARKSCVLQGGRGCGKTALLRFLSYQSQFSQSRPQIPKEALSTIGLYLKADSQYFSGFTGNGVDERKWRDIFEHALCLALSEQIIGSVSALNSNSHRLSEFGELHRLNFTDAVQGFAGTTVPPDLDGFEKWLRTQRQMLSRWFKNFDFEQPPTLLSLREFLSALILELRSKLAYLSGSVFAVYIDEYENLLDYQQRFLNTLIKSGEPPLIFHVAMKPNGMRVRGTIGTESIQEIADFRLIKLDELLRPNFKLFCAELFFFRLVSEAGLSEAQTPISCLELQSEASLTTRTGDVAYQHKVLREMERILPGKRNSEIAKDVLSGDSALYRRWSKIVEDGLKTHKSTLTPEAFLDRAFPEASLVCASLLHQRSKTVDQILSEFEKLRNGQSSGFREGDWIHHLLLGTLLLIYLPFRQTPCPVYAGFDAFTKLAGTSVRHFLELCHLSIGNFSPRDDLSAYSVSITDQASAAARASRNFRSEVSNCGDQGNRLLALVNFLGKLFRLSQGRSSQSEAERTHFSIVGDEISPQAADVLNEALKWSVVFEAPETKVKGNRYESSDYVLNPIYAPFFGVSYNKGRKLEIPTAEAETILVGRFEKFTQLLRQYEKVWSVEGVDQMTLDLEG